MGDYNTLKSFPNPRHCDPHLDQTKLNDLLPLTINGVLVMLLCSHLTPLVNEVLKLVEYLVLTGTHWLCILTPWPETQPS